MSNGVSGRRENVAFCVRLMAGLGWLDWGRDGEVAGQGFPASSPFGKSHIRAVAQGQQKPGREALKRRGFAVGSRNLEPLIFADFRTWGQLDRACSA